MRLFRALLILSLLALAACGSGGGGTSSDLAERARAEAKKVDPDAALVQVEFTDFGFATARDGLPDVTKSGPPKTALFNFYSHTGKGLRVVADINRPPMPAEIEKAMRERGYKAMRVDQGTIPYSTFMLPLPEKIGDVSRAIEAAQKDIEKICAGGDPSSNCQLLWSAELHMHWSGPQDGGGKPVWSVTFGQHPKTHAPVRVAIDAATNRIYTGRDVLPAGYNDRQTTALREVNLKVGRSFDAVWPAVVAAVQKQDPLYAPYAASLITYLRDVRAAGGKPILSEVHIQFARLTPSLLWDDLEAHVGWREGSDDQAVLFFSTPKRRDAPGEPVPLTLKADALPKAEPALADLLKKFPEKYAEVSTVWSKGCEDILTFTPGLSMWRCGVYVANQERTDLIFLWLTRQGNPYWQSGRAPLSSEYRLVAGGTPKNGWAWWTRVKHPDYWEYFLIDAMSGRPNQTFCTNPNTRSNTAQTRPCPG